jgi:hypothetical protein
LEFAGVPPELLLTVVQLLVALLKFWYNSTGGVYPIFDEENKSNGSPIHTRLDEALAVTIGDAITVITTVETAAKHGPAPSGSFVVSVSVTGPLGILGVYVDVSEFGLENMPLGAVHVALVALPPILPAKVIELPEHTFCGVPAFAVAG